MKSRGKGAIVNVASISSFVAQPGFVPYNTSKGAILQLSRCTAMDLGVDNIRVNCVCPGTIGTYAYTREFSNLLLQTLLQLQPTPTS
jgi:NAD(P)-dependent dehydrogenase (short-subunit alcohol dehydrogenase family)